MNQVPVTNEGIAGVRLLGARIKDETELHDVMREFRPLRIPLSWSPRFDALPGTIITAEHWRSSECSLRDHDRKLEKAAQRQQWLNIEFQAFHASTLFQILTRYQRFLSPPQAHDDDGLFTRVLDAHRNLHDVSKPLVRADYDHALDVLLWTLRLSPNAALPLQWAALFHDIERLRSESDVRVEQFAENYRAFKNRHAEGSAHWASEILAQCGVQPPQRLQVIRLIQSHEQPYVGKLNPDIQILADADALSFFSLNSPGFIDYYGPRHTEKKIAHTLERMSPKARSMVQRLKLQREIEGLLQHAIVSAYQNRAFSSEATE